MSFYPDCVPRAARADRRVPWIRFLSVQATNLAMLGTGRYTRAVVNLLYLLTLWVVFRVCEFEAIHRYKYHAAVHISYLLTL